MRRLLFTSVVAVLIVAACGTSELPQLPMSATGAAKQGAATADMSMPYRNVRYELADGVATDVDRADAYRFPPATRDDALKLASAFGVEGDVTANESGWSAGANQAPDAASTEARRPSLFLSRNGSFSISGSASVSSGVGCAEPAASPRDEPTCAATTTTVAPDLPTEAQAQSKARRLFTAGGVDVGDTQADVQRLAETVTVQFTPKVGGQTVDGFVSMAGFGPNGSLDSASGFVGDPQSVGSYELATLSRAIERLNAGYGLGSQERMLGVAPAIATDAPSPGGIDQTQPVIVELTGVRVGLMLLSDDAGTAMWLTPAYIFTTDGSGMVTAPAAADKYFPTTTTQPTSETKPPAPNCVSTADPITAQVCSDKTSYAAGDTVHFTITASDPDRAFSDGPCFDGVSVDFKDDAGPGDVQCMACSASVADGPGKLARTRDHTYTKAGDYQPVFTIKSGPSCGSGDPRDSSATVTLKVTVT